MMQDVIELVHVSGNQIKPVFLPHCTWDKFGDILANSGGRCVGLFDELVSFFATMNMYSSTKMQLADTKEYQDFLQMYTGKTKTCKTGIGYIHILCYLACVFVQNRLYYVRTWALRNNTSIQAHQFQTIS